VIKIKMKKSKGTTARNAVFAGLTAVVLAGCATPQSIHNRRSMARAGKLASKPYTDISVTDGRVEIKAGLSVEFDSLKDIPAGIASSGAAFAYGFAKPVYKEFWGGDSDYNGLAILHDGDRYTHGERAETAGEWTRWLAIAGGIAASQSGGSSERPQEHYEAPIIDIVEEPEEEKKDPVYEPTNFENNDDEGDVITLPTKPDAEAAARD
jgi:hypothetical protein